jgi:hypothetical protein
MKRTRCIVCNLQFGLCKCEQDAILSYNEGYILAFGMSGIYNWFYASPTGIVRIGIRKTDIPKFITTNQPASDVTQLYSKTIHNKIIRRLAVIDPGLALVLA